MKRRQNETKVTCSIFLIFISFDLPVWGDTAGGEFTVSTSMALGSTGRGDPPSSDMYPVGVSGKTDTFKIGYGIKQIPTELFAGSTTKCNFLTPLLTLTIFFFCSLILTLTVTSDRLSLVSELNNMIQAFTSHCILPGNHLTSVTDGDQKSCISQHCDDLMIATLQSCKTLLCLQFWPVFVLI